MSDSTANFIDPSKVTLSKERLEELYELLGRLYVADDRPWVIGYSGGKDSTAVVQVVWYALQKLPEGQQGPLKNRS